MKTQTETTVISFSDCAKVSYFNNYDMNKFGTRFLPMKYVKKI